MPVPKSLKKKIELAIKKIEAMKLKNNYYIFWKNEDEKSVTDIPDRSLVVKLTRYEPDSSTEGHTTT